MLEVSATGLHFDPLDNLYVVVKGSKEVTWNVVYVLLEFYRSRLVCVCMCAPFSLFCQNRSISKHVLDMFGIQGFLSGDKSMFQIIIGIIDMWANTWSDSRWFPGSSSSSMACGRFRLWWQACGSSKTADRYKTLIVERNAMSSFVFSYQMKSLSISITSHLFAVVWLCQLASSSKFNDHVYTMVHYLSFIF